MTIAQLRNEYSRASLDEKHVDRDPLRQFEAWFQQALSAQVAEPNAMVLATATPEGRPSARVVLLKGADSRGFTFFTDYSSRKGRELETNPQAALVFFWPELERQVRITGRISKITRKESEAYFRSRPRGSRLAASASLQSAPLKDRAQLEQAYAELDARHPGEEVPLPRRWGGYRVRPDSLEFWQGRPNRLHDRILFTRKRQGWRISRLSP